MTVETRTITQVQDSSDRLKMEAEPIYFHRKMYENQKLSPKALQRRSSFEKIMYICNQCYSAFPHVFLWLQDFQQTLGFEIRKMIPLIRSLFLTVGVYLGIALLVSQLIFCLVVTCKIATPSGLSFLLGCVAILGILALKSFVVINKTEFRQRTLSLTKKLQWIFT